MRFAHLSDLHSKGEVAKSIGSVGTYQEVHGKYQLLLKSNLQKTTYKRQLSKSNLQRAMHDSCCIVFYYIEKYYSPRNAGAS